MKKLVIAVTAGFCCFLISCNNTAETKGSSTDSVAEKNRMACRDIYEGIKTGDASKFGVIADDAVDHEGQNGKPVTGGDNIKKMLADMHNHFKDINFDIITDAANSDYVFTLVHFTATTSDTTQGAPAGTKIDMHGIDVSKFKDGKAVEHWGYDDRNEMMEMMKMMGPQGGMNNKMSSKMPADTGKKK
jgi:predicted ester cyclase